uniref:Uncharacterized protein n=1 Tax=Meloidogyne hapla TaxID=6305 RepID=A0A1I8BRD1_MELHA
MTITRLLFLPAIFVAATLFLWVLICNAPEWPQIAETSKINNKNGTLDNIEREDGSEEFKDDKDNSTSPSPFVLELPTQFENFTSFTARFRLYEKRHSAYIFTLFTCIYLYKQTFAIPGSFFMAGFILSDLRGWDDVFSTATMLKLSSFALLPLCYAMFVRKRRLQHINNNKSLKNIKCSIPQLSRKQKLFDFSTTKTIFPLNNDIEKSEMFCSAFDHVVLNDQNSSSSSDNN